MGKHKGQWKDEDDELIIGDYDVITVVGLTVINVAWNKTMLDIIEVTDIHNISTAIYIYIYKIKPQAPILLQNLLHIIAILSSKDKNYQKPDFFLS